MTFGLEKLLEKKQFLAPTTMLLQLPRTWVSRMMREPPRYVDAKICMMPLRPSSAPMTANTLLGTLVCSGVMAFPYRIIGRMYAKLKGMSANRPSIREKKRKKCTN